jgi:riboflavin synthase alpha subunit
MVNVFGRDRRQASPVGRSTTSGSSTVTRVQRGKITFEQFVDLNNRIGGHDIDGNVIAARTVADPKRCASPIRAGA